MKFSLKQNSATYEFTFKNIKDNMYVDIMTFYEDTGGSCYRTGLRKMLDGKKIIWDESDDFLNITDEARIYMEKIAKLLVFV